MVDFPDPGLCRLPAFMSYAPKIIRNELQHADVIRIRLVAQAKKVFFQVDRDILTGHEVDKKPRLTEAGWPGF